MAGNNNKRRGLGRGLGALIVDTATPQSTAPEQATTAPDNGIAHCAIDQIRPNPHQPREQFSETALQELADSIKTHGIIQPLILTADPDRPEQYWIIAGERRWRAAQRANLQSVPVIIREASSQQLVEWALVENIQRADLNPLEEGTAYQTLVHEFGLTHAEVAERVGRSRSTITNTLRLLDAPISVQQAITAQTISAGHARSLLSLKDDAQIEDALQQVLTNELTVRQTEALVTKWKQLEEQADLSTATDETELPTSHQAQITYMEDRFRSALGTRVNLNRSANGSGRLIIHFYNDDDLTQIYQLIAGEEDDGII